METERLFGKTINPDKIIHRIMNAEIYNLTVILTVSCSVLCPINVKIKQAGMRCAKVSRSWN